MECDTRTWATHYTTKRVSWNQKLP